jgi:hypothetical protein
MKRMLAITAIVGVIASLSGLCFACGDERRIIAARVDDSGAAELQGTDIIQGDVFVRESDFNLQLDKYAPESDSYNVPTCTGLSCLPWVLLGLI